jgi:hypothetical protein
MTWLASCFTVVRRVGATLASGKMAQGGDAEIAAQATQWYRRVVQACDNLTAVEFVSKGELIVSFLPLCPGLLVLPATQRRASLVMCPCQRPLR